LELSLGIIAKKDAPLPERLSGKMNIRKNHQLFQIFFMDIFSS